MSRVMTPGSVRNPVNITRPVIGFILSRYSPQGRSQVDRRVLEYGKTLLHRQAILPRSSAPTFFLKGPSRVVFVSVSQLHRRTSIRRPFISPVLSIVNVNAMRFMNRLQVFHTRNLSRVDRGTRKLHFSPASNSFTIRRHFLLLRLRFNPTNRVRSFLHPSFRRRPFTNRHSFLFTTPRREGTWFLFRLRRLTQRNQLNSIRLFDNADSILFVGRYRGVVRGPRLRDRCSPVP